MLHFIDDVLCKSKHKVDFMSTAQMDHSIFSCTLGHINTDLTLLSQSFFELLTTAHVPLVMLAPVRRRTERGLLIVRIIAEER